MLYADYTASMVPLWLTRRLGFAYLMELAHVAAEIGIIVGILPRLAATLEAIMMSLLGLRLAFRRLNKLSALEPLSTL